jgi:hypothetical protein
VLLTDDTGICRCKKYTRVAGRQQSLSGTEILPVSDDVIIDQNPQLPDTGKMRLD